MGKGLLALKGVASTGSDSSSRAGKRTRETRVSASDIRTSLADFEVLLASLNAMANDSNDHDNKVISLAVQEIEQAMALAQGNATASWESAEFLLDRALRRLGPCVSVKGKDNPLARRFVTLVNRDARRRGKHQVTYLNHRGLLNNKAADVTLKNVDKIVRASVMRGDATAVAISVLERAERTCERLGTQADIDKSPARQAVGAYIQGLARVSGTYVDARMSASETGLSMEQRARSESWLTTQALAQAQIAQALASGLAYRSANSVTNRLDNTGALKAHQRMLTNVVGPDVAREVSQGQWFAIGSVARSQIALSTGNDNALQKIKGVGFVVDETIGRDAVERHEKGHLSGPLMFNLFAAAIPEPKTDSARTHPAVAAAHQGIRKGLLVCLANTASTSSGGEGYQPQTAEEHRWAMIVASACRRSDQSIGVALKALAQAPQADRLRVLAKIACQRDDTNAQKTVLQVATKLAGSPKTGGDLIKQCLSGWEYANRRVVESRQLSGQAA